MFVFRSINRSAFDISKIENSQHNKKVQWFNHLVESEGEIQVIEESDVLIKVAGVTFCNTDISEILSRGRRSGRVGRRKGKIFLGH